MGTQGRHRLPGTGRGARVPAGQARLTKATEQHGRSPFSGGKTMRKKKVNAIKSFALLLVLGTAYQAMAQEAKTPYPNMAPIDQYLMTDQGAEIALARTAAPESISRDAQVL